MGCFRCLHKGSCNQGYPVISLISENEGVAALSGSPFFVRHRRDELCSPVVMSGHSPLSAVCFLPPPVGANCVRPLLCQGIRLFRPCTDVFMPPSLYMRVLGINFASDSASPPFFPFFPVWISKFERNARCIVGKFIQAGA